MPLIRRTGIMPPGGYAFRDPKTGKHFTDMLTFNDQVAAIIQHRKANVHLYTPFEFASASVAEELDAYTCQRLGFDNRYCTGGDLSQNTSDTEPRKKSEPVTGAPCPKCGSTQWTPIYCKTCSGKRITGYACSSCGTRR